MGKKYTEQGRLLHETFPPSHHVRMRHTVFITEKLIHYVGDSTYNLERSKIQVLARQVVPKTTRTELILPRTYTKYRRASLETFTRSQSRKLFNGKSLTSISPGLTKSPLTLQGCVSTNIQVIIPRIINPVLVRLLTSLSSTTRADVRSRLVLTSDLSDSEPTRRSTLS